MKRFLSIKHVAALLLMVAAPVAAGAVNQVSYTATYDVTQVRFGTDTLGGVTYSTISHKQMFNFGESGMPSLPVGYINFSVPYNAANFSVAATPVFSGTYLLDNPIYPLQAGGQCPAVQPDNSVYQNGTAYPSQSAWVVREDMMAGENHIVTVAVMPWLYHHTADTAIPDTLQIAGTVGITLTYELTDSPTLHGLVRKGASLREEGYKRTCKKVVNPDDVRSNAASASSNIYLRTNPNDSVENPDTYLIITTPQLLNSMKRLAALKRQEGMRVKVVTVDEAITDPIAIGGDNIGDEDNPVIISTDDLGKLRQFIRVHCRDRGTEYVLLAGTDVPSMNGSDMYFSCLEGDFMSIMDLRPELTVGRLLCNTSEQIDNYTDKLYLYELNPGRGDGSYLNDAFVLETNSFWTNEGSLVDDLNTMGMNTTFIINLEDVDGQPDNVPMSGSDVVNYVNDNRFGFMATICLGSPNNLRVHENIDYSEFSYIWADDTEKVAPGVTDNETGNGLNRLMNEDDPMAFYACTGNTMPYSPVQGYGNGPSLGEAFTTGKGYGGPAYIGFSNEVEHEDALYFLMVFGNEIYVNDYNLSGAMADCRSGSIHYLDNNTKLNYLGDPSLKMWTDVPTQYTGVQVTRTENGINVVGIPTANTTVAYCDNDGLAGSVETSSSSVTINDVSPNSTVMLYKHNCLPYIAPLLIQNTAISHSQYVIADVVKMGRAVDSNRTQGAVTVTDGVDYEIEASGKVTLAAGFKVERGASFAVQKSSYK